MKGVVLWSVCAAGSLLMVLFCAASEWRWPMLQAVAVIGWGTTFVFSGINARDAWQERER
jgi:hypothetical protein